jgi:hypothetical protein
MQNAIAAGGHGPKTHKLGFAVADALDMDMSDEAQKERVKRMLDVWIEKGLKESCGPSPKNKSRDRPEVIVGNRTVEGET